MTSLYILFLLAPVVTNLGEFSTMQECERIGKIVASARHQNNADDSSVFYKNRLICVQSNK